MLLTLNVILSSGRRTNGPCKERGVCDGKTDWSVGTGNDSTLDPDPKEEANWTVLVAEKYPSEGISERTATSSSWITSPLQNSDWQEYVSLSTVSENPNQIKLISLLRSALFLLMNARVAELSDLRYLTL